MTETSHENRMTLSIRLIRSFEHRNIRHVVLHCDDSSMTGAELKQRVLKMLPNENLPPPFKTFAFGTRSLFSYGSVHAALSDLDTLKIEHYPHKAKTNDLVVRREDNDQLLIEDNRHLSEYNVVDGTEIAFFKRSDYELYLKNPVLAMD